MNQLNSLILEGTVADNIIVTEPKPEFKVGKFPIAVNRKIKTAEDEWKNETSIFDIECYGFMTEKMANWLLKGQGVRVVGRLKQQNYQDEENKTRSKVFVVAEHIEFKKMKEIIEKETKEVCNDLQF